MAYDSNILVVIPYLASEAQGMELEYTIRGWLRHFKHPHKIVVIGDRPRWMEIYEKMANQQVQFISCPRVNQADYHPFEYLPHLDHVHKFRTLREYFPESNGFIYTCDDIYPVNDFGLGEVLVPKISKRVMVGDATSPNGWKRDAAKTLALCTDNGYDAHEWVCHLPVYYEWDKLLEVYKDFGCDRHSYVVEDIYFNRYYKGRLPILLDEFGGPFSYRFTDTKASSAKMEYEIQNHIWVNNSPTGYSETLMRILRDRILFDTL